MAATLYGQTFHCTRVEKLKSQATTGCADPISKMDAYFFDKLGREFKYAELREKDGNDREETHFVFNNDIGYTLGFKRYK